LQKNVPIDKRIANKENILLAADEKKSESIKKNINLKNIHPFAFRTKSFS
jgi:hypothetical protein